MKEKQLWLWIIIAIVVILAIGVFIFYVISPLLNNSNSSSNNFDEDSSSIICNSNTYNCGDFTVCEEVTKVFDECKDRGFGDIHSLDKDDNGVPCESLCG